ncbi:uncharacterized protein LOC134193022 [Corticium candelabrum]|uniref:uncharacterized protein LOC134193022 n=1 Tax=Corticium candelabrum TaxID=121492 RepID=UPI002E274568|nr:uncharacterized protein LOC134193022 [Corticium candelabrum]
MPNPLWIGQNSRFKNSQKYHDHRNNQRFISYNSESSGNQKRKSEDQKVRPGAFAWRFSTNICAYSLETFGCWGEKAEDYLKKLSQLSRDEDEKPNASTFKTYWRAVFSVSTSIKFWSD